MPDGLESKFFDISFTAPDGHPGFQIYQEILTLNQSGVPTLNTLELIAQLRKETGILKESAHKIVYLFFDSMSEALAADDRVEIRGLCCFYVKKHKPYMGRNPKIGEKVKIGEKRLPFFKCGKELKVRVDAQ